MRSTTLFEQPEVQGEPGQDFVLQGSKMLKVRLSEGAVRAKKGSMVAYQGDVKFQAAAAGGVGKFLKKQLTGEGDDLMLVQGSGEVFLADLAQDVHLLALEGDGISCNGDSVLAFDAGIEHDIERVKGMGILAGGFFNLTLDGSGWVALLCEGPPIVLDVAEAPTFVDPQAVVCWTRGLRTTFNRDTSGGVGNLLRGGSGETFQMGFEGEGWVVVQPSEGLMATVRSVAASAAR